MQDVLGVAASLLLFKINSLVMNLLDQWCESAHELCIAPPMSMDVISQKPSHNLWSTLVVTGLTKV